MIDYKISPTTKPVIDKDSKEEPLDMVLEDKDWALIMAIRDLTSQVRRLANG